MRKITNIIASVLLFAVVISGLVVNVFAATTHDTFSLSVSTGSYSHILPPHYKSNYSDMMIYIGTGSNQTYYVRAVACDSNGTGYMINSTFWNNRIIDHYTVLKGTMYSIPNQVRYNVDKYATFGILSPGNPGTITGRWSEDTSTQYETPIY